MKICRLFLILSLTLLFCCDRCYADYVYFKNGKRLVGKIKSIKDGKIELCNFPEHCMIINQSETERIERSEYSFPGEEKPLHPTESISEGSKRLWKFHIEGWENNIKDKEGELGLALEPIVLLQLIKIGYAGPDAFMGYRSKDAYFRQGYIRNFALKFLRECIFDKNISKRFKEYYEDIIYVAIPSIPDTFSDNGLIASQILEEIGEKAIPHMMEFFKDQKWRSQVAYTMRVILGKGAKLPEAYIPVLASALQEEKTYHTSSEILLIMKEIKDPNKLNIVALPIAELIEKSKDMGAKEASSLVYSAFKILAKINDEQTVTSISPMLKKAIKGEYGSLYPTEALQILARAGEKSVPMLVEFWKTENGPLADTAGELLISRPGKKAIESLVMFLGDAMLQKRTVDLLLKIKDKKAIPFLITSLDNSDKTIKKHVLLVLQKLTGKNFGLNSKKWNGWWESQKDIFELRWVQ